MNISTKGLVEPESSRLTFANLFRLGSLVFVVAILSYVLFYSINGARPNSFAFNLFCYSLAAFGVALASGGVVDLFTHRRFAFDWWTAGKTSVSVIAGLALTLLSAPYPPYGAFELSYTGFPLPFASTFYGLISSFTSVNPIAFLIDCAFWVALSSPAVWLVASATSRDLRAVGRLEAMGAAAFLTYGPIPGWEGLISTGALNPLQSAIGPVGSTFVLFFFPGLLVGTLISAGGHRVLGYTIVFACLLFVSLLVLAVLAALQQTTF